MKSKSLIKIFCAAALSIAAIAPAQAADKTSDPSGTYFWTFPGRNGGPDRTNTLVLKLAGDKLSGKLSSPGRGGKITDTDITDGKVTATNFSFTVVRTYNGNSNTNTYSGTVTDGAIKGKREYVDRNGETQSRDWEAKPQK